MSVANVKRLPFVLSGIPRSRTLLYTNEQLADRFREVIYVETFTAETGKHNSMETAVGVFKTALGDFPTINLTAQHILQKLTFATAGRLRDMRWLFVRAVQIAFTNEKPRIDLPTLSSSFCDVIYKNAQKHRNPFEPEFDGHPLTRAGEPFAE